MMRGLRRSWSFPVILILSLSYLCCNLSEARHHHQKHPSAVVVGAVYCETCFQDAMPKGSHYISGATVAVECAEGATRPAFYQEVTTDKEGNFRVHLPFSVSKHVKEIEGCTVKLVKSSDPYCAVASSASSSLIRLKERKDGKHIYSAGFFTFKPLKQPGLCNQQPSVTKSQLNSLGDMLPPLPTPPFGSLPVPVPLVPTTPNAPLLPNLPLPNPELPLPPVPKLPNMPLPPADKAAKISNNKFTPIPQKLPSKADEVSKKSLKPSVTKNSLGDMLPPLPNTDIPGLLTPDLPQLPPLPVPSLPVPVPLVPTAPNAPLLPNLPLPNPELPLPQPQLPTMPLPPFSGLPVNPTDKPAEIPTKRWESTVEESKFFFFPPIVGSPSGGLPTIPNPLQPAPLLPNPLQPPPTPLIPNPFQPPTPPSIVPGVPIPGLPNIPGVPGVPGLPNIPVLTPPSPPPSVSILPPLLPPGFGFPGIPPATKTTKMNP